MRRAKADPLRDELFGRQVDLAALPALLDPSWVVGDLGCGTGRWTERLAPFAARVIAVDGSAAMLRAAKERLGRCESVEVRQGDRFLLCSDGLHGYLDPEEIPDLIALGGKRATEAFIQLANERGGSDNITCVLVEVD